MKITLLLNQDAASLLAFNLLYPHIKHHALSVISSLQVGSSSHLSSALLALSQYEKTTAVTGLLSDHPDYLNFNQLESLNIPYGSLTSINCDQGITYLANTQPDLIISIRFGLILKEQAIALPKYGVLNFHSGLLPQYRGVMATFWSMFEHQEQIGATLHYIEDGSIDTGGIVNKSLELCDYGKTYFENVLSLYQSGIPGLIAAINQVENQAPGFRLPILNTGIEKDRYYTFPEETHLNQFTERGLRLF